MAFLEMHNGEEIVSNSVNTENVAGLAGRILIEGEPGSFTTTGWLRLALTEGDFEDLPSTPLPIAEASVGQPQE
jgi:hypothetical protein